MNDQKPIPELPDIEDRWKRYKEKKAQQFPQNNLRASSIGHPCNRYHYYSIRNWKERPLPDARLQSIYDEGHLHEKDVLHQLTEMGFEITDGQRSYQIDTPLITGSIDGILRYNGTRFPFDVKTINPYDFVKISSVEDLLFSKKVYLRQYPAQLQMYLLQTESEIGFLIFKNKITGELKCIWTQIDYDFCESLLQRAEQVYDSLEKENPPDRINDFQICNQCPFKAICLPDLRYGKGIQLLDDESLIDMLNERDSLLEAHQRFEILDKKIKESCKEGGPGEKIAGDWLIRIVERKRSSYVVPEKTYYHTAIIKIEGDQK